MRALRVHLQDAGDGLVQKGPVVRDDQNRRVARQRRADQPVFQPFQHVDVQVIGRLVQQQELRRGEQHTRQRQARLLPAAQGFDRRIQRDVPQPQCAQGLADLSLELRCRLHALPGSRRIPAAGRRFQAPPPGRPPAAPGGRRLVSSSPVMLIQEAGQSLAGRRGQSLRQVTQAQPGRAEMVAARVGALHPSQDAQQGGFTAAVRPNQAQPLARVEVE